MKFKFFRIAGRIVGGLLLCIALLWTVGLARVAAFPIINDALRTDLLVQPRNLLLDLGNLLLAIPVISAMAIAGFKLLKLRKPEPADISLKL